MRPGTRAAGRNAVWITAGQQKASLLTGTGFQLALQSRGCVAYKDYPGKCPTLTISQLVSRPKSQKQAPGRNNARETQNAGRRLRLSSIAPTRNGLLSHPGVQPLPSECAEPTGRRQAQEEWTGSMKTCGCGLQAARTNSRNKQNSKCYKVWFTNSVCLVG